MGRPSPALASLFRIPRLLYRAGLGWLPGRRLLEVTHRGRRSGRLHTTVLEAIAFDETSSESIVVSAYGPGADWYRNIRAEPATRIRTGRMDYRPRQRFVSDGEAALVAARFCREHPLEARLVVRTMRAIGADVPADAGDPVEMVAAMPMVAFRPEGRDGSGAVG